MRGEIAAAAEAYRERAQRPSDRVEATVRRAALLGGPLGHPETALVELENLRGSPLSAAEDLRVGTALVDLLERRLNDPGPRHGRAPAAHRSPPRSPRPSAGSAGRWPI